MLHACRQSFTQRKTCTERAAFPRHQNGKSCLVTTAPPPLRSIYPSFLSSYHIVLKMCGTNVLGCRWTGLHAPRTPPSRKRDGWQPPPASSRPFKLTCGRSSLAILMLPSPLSMLTCAPLLMLPRPPYVQRPGMLAQSGIDCVFIDTEHVPIPIDTLGWMFNSFTGIYNI